MGLIITYKSSTPDSHMYMAGQSTDLLICVHTKMTNRRNDLYGVYSQVHSIWTGCGYRDDIHLLFRIFVNTRSFFQRGRSALKLREPWLDCHFYIPLHFGKYYLHKIKYSAALVALYLIKNDCKTSTCLTSFLQSLIWVKAVLHVFGNAT